MQHRALQRAVGKTLDLAVDRERQVLAVLAGADRLDVLDHAPEAVLEDATAARPAAERILVGELDAFLAGIVDAGETDEMRGHFSSGIVAPVLAAPVDAAQPKLRDGIGRIGG